MDASTKQRLSSLVCPFQILGGRLSLLEENLFCVAVSINQGEKNPQ